MDRDGYNRQRILGESFGILFPPTAARAADTFGVSNSFHPLSPQRAIKDAFQGEMVDAAAIDRGDGGSSVCQRRLSTLSG